MEIYKNSYIKFIILYESFYVTPFFYLELEFYDNMFNGKASEVFNVSVE